MRRAIAEIDGEVTEIRLRNISAMGALVECPQPVAPGTTITIDIVGVGPVVGLVRWAQSGKFGVQFTDGFDLARLAPKKDVQNKVTMLRPWYIDQPGSVLRLRPVYRRLSDAVRTAASGCSWDWAMSMKLMVTVALVLGAAVLIVVGPAVRDSGEAGDGNCYSAPGSSTPTLCE